MNRITLTALCMLVGGFVSVNAHDPDININIDNSTPYSDSGSAGRSHSGLNSDVSAAVATAASMSFCQFNYGPALQGCIGTATYDDEWAVNFQLGKRVDTLLLTGGMACDDEFNECAAGGAVSWNF